MQKEIGHQWQAASAKPAPCSRELCCLGHSAPEAKQKRTEPGQDECIPRQAASADMECPVEVLEGRSCTGGAAALDHFVHRAYAAQDISIVVEVQRACPQECS